MSRASTIAFELQTHLSMASSSFSIGSLGAIAEFHHTANEAIYQTAANSLTLVTALGGIGITLHNQTVPLAYEALSAMPGRWQQGVAFCLPTSLAASCRRTVLTELGPDLGAIRESEREHILFDVGLGARNVDFCVRSDDRALIALLRNHVSQSVLSPSSPVMPAILEANPHRVALSCLGRIEVYQAIPRVKTPEGPHTHVLPKLLAGGRTHSANIPMPPGHLPCLMLYPANPLTRADGERQAFCGDAHDSFQELLAKWGDRRYCREKQRATEALLRSDLATTYQPHDSRLGRLALRIALRQINAEQGGQTEALRPWLERFERNRVPEPGS